MASVNISVERMLDACATAVDRCATLGLLLALSLLHEKQTPQWLFTDLHMRAIVAAHIFTDRRLAELTADNGDGTASGNSAAANATSPSNSGDGIASLTRWQPLFALPGDRHARLHASRAHLCRYGLLLDAAPIAGMVGEMHQFVQRTVRETRLTVDAAGSSALVRTLEDLLCYHYQHAEAIKSPDDRHRVLSLQPCVDRWLQHAHGRTASAQTPERVHPPPERVHPPRHARQGTQQQQHHHHDRHLPNQEQRLFRLVLSVVLGSEHVLVLRELSCNAKEALACATRNVELARRLKGDSHFLSLIHI